MISRWPRMSCYVTLDRAEQEEADHLGYATYCSAPEQTRHRGHRPGMDLIWQNICGRRGEMAIVKLGRNGGHSVKWWQLGTHAEAVARRRDPDIELDGLPIQSKANDYPRDRILFYVNKEAVIADQIFVLTSLARFPLCEVMGWVWGRDLQRYGVLQDHGAPGLVLKVSHPAVRDFMEVLQHPGEIEKELFKPISPDQRLLRGRPAATTKRR